MTQIVYGTPDNDTNLTVEIKSGRHTVPEAKLHPEIEQFLIACHEYASVGSVHVVFTTNKRSNARYRGAAWCYPNKVIIYTAQHTTIEDVLDTVAHEYGHLQHHYIEPESWNYPYRWRESYAEDFATQMLYTDAQHVTASNVFVGLPLKDTTIKTRKFSERYLTLNTKTPLWVKKINGLWVAHTTQSNGSQVVASAKTKKSLLQKLEPHKKENRATIL